MSGVWLLQKASFFLKGSKCCMCMLEKHEVIEFEDARGNLPPRNCDFWMPTGSPMSREPGKPCLRSPESLKWKEIWSMIVK